VCSLEREREREEGESDYHKINSRNPYFSFSAKYNNEDTTR
jgi:hypothetical protein